MAKFTFAVNSLLSLLQTERARELASLILYIRIRKPIEDFLRTLPLVKEGGTLAYLVYVKLMKQGCQLYRVNTSGKFNGI